MKDEELINLIKAKAKELGRTPKRREFKHYNLAIKRFGSWNNSIEKVGLKVTKRANYTEEQLIKLIQDKAVELDRVPRKDDFTNVSTIINHFGTFSNAIRKCGMIAGIRTEEELLHQLKSLSENLGRTPSISDAEENGLSPSIFPIRFGSWNNALKKAGIDINFKRTNVTETDEELIEEYILLCNDLNRLATTRDLNRHKHNKNVFEDRFGNITNLKELVINDTRLKISDKSYIEGIVKYSKEQLEDILVQIYINNGYKSLSAKKLKKELQENKLPSLNTFYKRFGTTKISELWDMVNILAKQ